MAHHGHIWMFSVAGYICERRPPTHKYSGLHTRRASGLGVSRSYVCFAVGERLHQGPRSTEQNAPDVPAIGMEPFDRHSDDVAEDLGAIGLIIISVRSAAVACFCSSYARSARSRNGCRRVCACSAVPISKPRGRLVSSTNGGIDFSS